MSDRAAIRCNEIVEKVGPYVDGELGADERARVEAHLNVCVPCAEVATEIREMDSSAARIPVPEVTVEEWTAVWSRVEAARRSSPIIHIRTRLWRWAALPVAAAVLAGVFIVPGLFGPEAPISNEADRDIVPERVSGPAPDSIDRIEGVGEEDDASYVQYSNF